MAIAQKFLSQIKDVTSSMHYLVNCMLTNMEHRITSAYYAFTYPDISNIQTGVGPIAWVWI